MRGSNYLDSVLFDLAITHLATVKRASTIDANLEVGI